MTAVSFPIIHPRSEVSVRVDTDTLERWQAAGLSMKWEYHPDGPTFRGPEGATQKVADVILGRRAYFTNGDVFNLTKANLRAAA